MVASATQTCFPFCFFFCIFILSSTYQTFHLTHNNIIRMQMMHANTVFLSYLSVVCTYSHRAHAQLTAEEEQQG